METTDAATGMQLAQMGRYADALPFLENANRVAPDDVPVLHAVASLLHWAGRGAEAAECYRIASALLPHDTDVLGGMARSLLLLGEHDEATVFLDRVLQNDPYCADAGGLLSTLLGELHDNDAICRILQQLFEKHPTSSSLLFQYAKALKEAEHLSEAKAAFERYHFLQPEDPQACVELGILASYYGDLVGAMAQFRRALTADPCNPSAWWEIAMARDGQLDPPELEHVLNLVQTTNEHHSASDFHDILARYYNRAKEFRIAAAHINSANAHLAQLVPPHKRYSTEQREQETDVSIGFHSAELFHRLRNAGSADRRPIFVFGLPRSGTTLLEQMLASHPQIVGIGEQTTASKSFKRALIESTRSGTNALTAAAVGDAANWHLQEMQARMQRLGIREDAQHVVDKLPDNYMFAGWLSIAFPNAILIHCVRDPRDVAVSCWQMHFSKITWSLELDHIAHRIEQHRRIMRHWRTTIGHRLSEIHYELLVANPERVLRSVLATAQLDWHPDVLTFAESKRFVSSASRQQVREPLHTRSVERWRNYEAALQPILPRLHAIAERDALEAGPDTAL